MALLLKTLGLTIPQPEVPADGSNPLGFGEPQWVVDLHTQLLNRVHVHTADARPQAWGDTVKLQYDLKLQKKVAAWLERSYGDGHGDVVVVKDPRTLWFVPLWRAVAEHVDADMSVITMLRHPAEVVASKKSAYGQAQTTESQRTAGWINTMLYLEKATRTLPRDYVLYDGLLEDWTKALTQVSDRLDLPQIRLSPARLQVEAAALVDVDLRRQRNGWESLSVPKGVIELADRTWDGLNDLADPLPEQHATVAERLDGTRAEYVTLYEEAEAIAQSSILAASRQARSKALASRPAARRGQAPAGTSPTGPGRAPTRAAGPRTGRSRPRRALWALVIRYYGRLPASLRAAVPTGVRTSARQKLTQV